MLPSLACECVEDRLGEEPLFNFLVEVGVEESKRVVEDKP